MCFLYLYNVIFFLYSYIFFKVNKYYFYIKLLKDLFVVFVLYILILNIEYFFKLYI